MKILFAVVFVLIIAFGTFWSINGFSDFLKMRPQSVMIGDNRITVEVADTKALREQGLSGRQSLFEAHGMLFVFESEGRPGIWMKDMLFSIDIIFAAADGTIVTIYQDVSPDTYSRISPKLFYPTSNALYALEVPAGYTEARGVQSGQKMKVE